MRSTLSVAIAMPKWLRRAVGRSTPGRARARWVALLQEGYARRGSPINHGADACPSLYLQKEGLPYLYGSAASRSPSPRKLKARMTNITGTIGNSSQG